jgi:nucleotide-binding universal stress UspA family protein
MIFSGGLMYTKILVPLDGSQLSECSLEQVKQIVTTGITELILLRVIEPIDRDEAVTWAAVGYTIADIHNKRKVEAEEYITRTVERLKREGIYARGEIVEGRATETIIDYSKKHQVELIIMSSHGRSGITRWAFGSVADKVVRHSTIPVLMVSAPGCRTKTE